jgi:hypothetical protein
MEKLSQFHICIPSQLGILQHAAHILDHKRNEKNYRELWIPQMQLRMLQRANAIMNSFCQYSQDATTNECYNEQFLSIQSGCYNERMQQWTVFVNSQDATTNECNNEQFLSIQSGCYNQWMQQWTVFVNTARMLQPKNATMKSFCQYSQDATTNTDATTNVEEYFWLM